LCAPAALEKALELYPRYARIMALGRGHSKDIS
jgi:hypothetical protein